MFCCALLCVHSSIAIILMGKGAALLDLSSWCLVMVLVYVHVTVFKLFIWVGILLDLQSEI